MTWPDTPTIRRPCQQLPPSGPTPQTNRAVTGRQHGGVPAFSRVWLPPLWSGDCQPISLTKRGSLPPKSPPNFKAPPPTLPTADNELKMRRQAPQFCRQIISTKPHQFVTVTHEQLCVASSDVSDADKIFSSRHAQPITDQSSPAGKTC